MVVPIRHGITANEAQLAIFDSRSVLQKQDGITRVPSTVLPQVRKEKKIRSVPPTSKLKTSLVGR